MMYPIIEDIVKKHGNFAENECLLEASAVIKSSVASIEEMIDLLEADLGVNFTVLITPEPLTPVQRSFINACVQSEEFDEGLNQ